MSTQGKKQDPYYQAQAILSRRDHSESEVRYKMRKRGFSASQVDTVMNWLKERKFVDDSVFAARYVESTLRFKTVGRRWLRFKLQQKGITAETIDTALEQYSAQQEEEQRHKAVKLWKERHPDEPKPDALARFLASRGFSTFS